MKMSMPRVASKLLLPAGGVKRRNTANDRYGHSPMISRSSTATATAVSPSAGAGAAAAGGPLGAVALDSTLGRWAHPTNMVVRTRAETVVTPKSVLIVWSIFSQSRLAREVECAYVDGLMSRRGRRSLLFPQEGGRRPDVARRHEAHAARASTSVMSSPSRFRRNRRAR
jgi:hypothetical protein